MHSGVAPEANNETPIGRSANARLATDGELFRACFAHAPIGFAVTDIEGRILQANPAYCAITGYTEAELRSMNFSQLEHPEDLTRMTENLRALLAGEIPDFVIEKRFIRKNGETVWVQNSVSTIRDQAGRPVRIVRLTQDINERVRLHHAHEESESRFRLFMSNLPDYAWIKTSDGRYVFMNNRLESVLPSHRNDWSGRTDQDFWPSEIAVEYRKNDQSVLENRRQLQTLESWEYLGEHRDLLVNKFPIFDEHGEAVMVGGVSLDVTDQKRTERALLEAEQKYRGIFENVGEGIFQSTPDGRYVVANPALARMFGYESPEELIRSCNDISKQVYVDATRREEFKRLIESNDVVRDFEAEVYRKDRRTFWMSVNARAVRDLGGNISYYEGTSQDITERKKAEKALRESEERYRELFENAKDVIYVHNMSGIYTSVNRAAEELSGYPRNEIIGRPFWDFVAREYVKQTREYLCQKLDEVGETNYEIEIITKSGKRVPVEVSSRFIYEDGVPIGVQGTARDITERKRAQMALQTYSRRLIEAQEAERQRIARELHDEIGQVLTALKINLHTIQSACQTNKCLPRIEESMAIIDEAIGQVRELSFNLRPALLDDLGLTAALRWYVDQFAQRTGVRTELVSDIDAARLPRELEIACFRIAQEALTNIARHAHASKAAVHLKRSAAHLYVTISDNGVGFDVRNVERQVSALGLRGMSERASATKGALLINSKRDVGTQIRALFRLKQS